MFHVVVMAIPLAAGLGLALLAGRRGWVPSLAVALAVGAAFRVVVMIIAVGDTWQPYDLAGDFRSAADTVLDGRDPMTYLGEGRWHFLPFMAYVLVAERELGHLLGLPWDVVARLGPMAADLALIPLVRRLATRDHDLRAFQYACAPLGLMVSSLHGQFTPYTLLFGLGALLAARSGRAHVAGPLAGLSVTVASWSALLVPGVLLLIPGVRRRLAVLGWTAVVPLAFLLSSTPLLGTPLHRLPDTVRAIMSARPLVGEWGWTTLVTGGDLDDSPALARLGTPLLALGLLAALWWWRRSDPMDLTLALLLVFLVMTYRFGSQYLAWVAPLLIARPTKGGWPALSLSAAWAAAGYLYLTRLSEAEWWHAHSWWALSSLVVIPFLVRALPWDRREAAAREDEPGVSRAAPEPARGRAGAP